MSVVSKARKPTVAIVGAGLGFLGAVGIYFVPGEPYPGFIVAAGVLNGALAALFIAALLPTGCRVIKALLVGGIVGLLMATVVFLAKGGWVSWDAPYVVPSGVVTGVILGAVVRWIKRARPADAP